MKVFLLVLIAPFAMFLVGGCVLAIDAQRDFLAHCRGDQIRPIGVQSIELSHSRYPHVVAHIERSWRLGYPRVLEVNRDGASSRRSRLLYRWRKAHPQPVGDHLDLDEAPAAVLRDVVKADVLPVPEHENRSAGAKLRREIAPFCEGTRVRYRFTALSSSVARGDA